MRNWENDKKFGVMAVFIMLVFCLGIHNVYAIEKVANEEVVKLKNGRKLSPWFIYYADQGEEKNFAKLETHIHLVSSISIFGIPTPGFVKKCHDNNVLVYLAESGNESTFGTAEQRKKTIEEYLKKCQAIGFDGIDLDLEHLDPSLKDKYSVFLRQASEELRRNGKKLAHCVGYYPPMIREPFVFWYDPKVIGQTCDMVRIMGYDAYHSAGKLAYALDRDDCQGVGPTCSLPWARDAIRYWTKYVPQEKLIFGLPAYSNDYNMMPDGGGTQVPCSKRTAPDESILADGTKVDKYWLWYEEINTYRYLDKKGHPHIFYATDADSTKVLLEKAVNETSISGISFWHYEDITPEMWKVVTEWSAQKAGRQLRSP